MSENLKTIRELADEFKVSKQAVRKRLTDEFRANYVETVDRNGVATLVVTVTGYMLLKQHFSSGNDSEKVGSNVGGNTGNVDVTSDSKQTTDNSYVFKILEQQLTVKDKQIDSKDRQIDSLTKLLDQSQQLQLMAEKKIKELQKIEQSKTEDTVTEPTNPNNQNETTEAPKKWWQFWN